MKVMIRIFFARWWEKLDVLHCLTVKCSDLLTYQSFVNCFNICRNWFLCKIRTIGGFFSSEGTYTAQRFSEPSIFQHLKFFSNNSNIFISKKYSQEVEKHSDKLIHFQKSKRVNNMLIKRVSHLSLQKYSEYLFTRQPFMICDFGVYYDLNYVKNAMFAE